jgi:serine protease
MAAPHVAGVFALMRSANKDLDYVAISNLLVAGELTIPLGELNGGRNDSFGYGLIDAQKAVAAALASDGNPPAPQPWLGVFPRALNFGATLESLVITVRNNSGGDLNILSIESSEPWLTIPPLNGLTDYEVRVERGGLAEGSHSATLTVTSDQNDIEIPVIVQKSNTVLTGDAGHLYVRLIDPVTGNIREVETDVDDGEYAWQIDQLPPGEYQLVAYTDADNDNRLCDPGEACGSYLTATQLFKLELTSDQGNLTDLDFQVSFGVGLSDPDSPGKP